jgi:hypothetical protein
LKKGEFKDKIKGHCKVGFVGRICIRKWGKGRELQRNLREDLRHNIKYSNKTVKIS